MIRKGTKVKWKWGNGHAQGKVVDTYAKSITLKIKGSKVTRNGSDEDKALKIDLPDSDYALKLESEVERVD